jgi:hypothetical protein
MSGQTDRPSDRALDVLCDNLRRCLDGEPVVNQVDWARGY